MNVLIVEDDQESRYMLEALFKGNGCNVLTAADGIAALEILRRDPVDVVVSDIMMPRMDGFQLCRILKTDPGLKHIPFVIYTATYTSPRDANYAIKIGADRYIEKPADPQAFWAAVRDVVEQVYSDSASAQEDVLDEEESLRLYGERLAERLQQKVAEVEAELETRREIEDLLRESEKRLKTAQRMAQLGDFTWNADTGEVSWSDALFDLLGYSRDEKIDFALVNAAIHHPDDLPEVTRWLNDALDSGTGKLPAFEYRLLRKNGETIYVHTVGEIRRNERGEKIVFASIQDITESKQTELRLRESEQRFRRIYEHTGMGLCQVSLDFRIEHANTAYCEMLGYSSAEIIGMHLADITHPEVVKENLEKQEHLGRGEIEHFRMEKRFRHRDGHTVHGILDANLIRNEDGVPLYFLGSVVDITERKELEQQLLQAQKLESIGRLAGGVAHDYNNMLGVILGSAELALKHVSPSHPVHSNLEQIRTAARRSADITRQLLAFARKQTINPQVLDLNESLEGMLKMLRHLLGEDIELTWVPGRYLCPVHVDPVQLDQILVNLCVNARDALSAHRGTIIIESGAAEFDPDYCSVHQEFRPGKYVMLAVSDDGCGMDSATMAHVFEPFFTTKETGEGTGLGLATVYGIVKQNKGFIHVYSEPGNGSTFRIYLPCCSGKETVSAAHSSEPVHADGQGQTVLVVEDESTMLELVCMMLEELGYHALGAQNQEEALTAVRQYRDAIRLLIIDVVMPEINGRELADKLKTLEPELLTLYMSGYTANIIAHRGVLDQGVHFLQKPFSMQELADKLNQVLGQP